MTEAILIYATAPDSDVAATIAQNLVADGLAACVNFFPGATSVFQWENNVETATETLLFIKTTEEKSRLVKEAITRVHPYDEPAILALPINERASSSSFLHWVTQATR